MSANSTRRIYFFHRPKKMHPQKVAIDSNPERSAALILSSASAPARSLARSLGLLALPVRVRARERESERAAGGGLAVRPSVRPTATLIVLVGGRG